MTLLLYIHLSPHLYTTHSILSTEMSTLFSKLPQDWLAQIDGSFSDYKREVVEQSLLSKADTVIYPPVDLVFQAFHLTPYNDVKVVILGQDPFHSPGQAQGLAFSVPDNVPIPSSLRNIFKEINNDCYLGLRPSPQSGNLTKWAQQGVLLLNTCLTVEAGKPNSHKGLGWESFTEAVILQLAEQKHFLVFMFWGAQAQSWAKLVNTRHHLVLMTSHPSGLSAHRGFFGCKHFSRCNDYLKAHHQPEIQWM